MSKYDKGLNKIISDIKSLSYADKYGTTILICCILLIILFVVVSYFRLSSEFQPIRDNWVARRCEPAVIPLAGIINAPEDETILGYTSKNFTYCINNMLKPVAQKAVSPFDILMNGLLKIFNGIKNMIESMRNMVSKLRGYMAVIVRDIYNRLINIIAPLQDIIIRGRDIFGKVNAILQTSTNMIITLLMIIKAFIAYIISAAANILIIMAIVMVMAATAIAVCWFWCPWVLPYAIYTYAFVFTIYIVVIVLLTIIIVFGQNVLGKGARVTLFDAPACFDENTKIELKDGTTKEILNINVGDILKDGGVVTATMKLSTGNEKIYILNNVIVSGSHSVKNKNKWTKVPDHPEANRLFDYDKPYLYCLNTTTKKIHINNRIFMDWDEVDEKVLNRLEKHYATHNTDYVKNSDNEIIFKMLYKYYNGGIPEDVQLTMHGPENDKFIKDIKIGDKLKNGIQVYGIVETNSDMVLNKNNIYNSRGKDTTKKFSKKLYHLLTDNGYFFVNGIKFMDYNNYIDSTC